MKARAVGVVLAVGLLAGCGWRAGSGPFGTEGIGAAPTPARQGQFAPYVALGDSYTAGPRIPKQGGTPRGCARSDENYPSVVARQLGLGGADFRDVSCSGATAGGIAAGEGQNVKGGVAAAQLDALSARDRLVTVGVGGNDVGYFGVLETCARLGIVARAIGEIGPESAPCQLHYGAAGLDGRIAQAGRSVSALLDEVHRRAPEAKVLVVGYPAVFPGTGGGEGCGSLLLTGGDLVFLRGLEERLDAMLQQRATAAGAVYVDTYTPSAGHDACEAADDRWVEPLLPSRGAAPLHPNAEGERGIADAVLAALRKA